MRKFLNILLLLAGLSAAAQKKPLDHSVYDKWQSINERYISNDGQWVVYTITPQEGDAVLYIHNSNDSLRKIEIKRGYAATITEDNRFVICKIRAPYAAAREAKLKKKLPNEMPKDSLAIVELGKNSIIRIPNIRSYKTPQKGNGQWVAYLHEKPLPGSTSKTDSLTQLNYMLRLADSLVTVADSIRNKANEAKTKGLQALKEGKKETKSKTGEEIEEGTELVLRNLYTGEEKKYQLVSDYYFSKTGNAFVIEITRSKADPLLPASILWYNVLNGKTDTVMSRFNDARNFTIDEDGSQLAFIAERDSVQKALQKFYKLWYYRPGMDSAQLRVQRNTAGVAKGLTVSESATLLFSKNGQRLFFGLMPVRKPKDTTLIEFETAKLDIWHYHDDYLQPQQLVQLKNDLQKSYTAVLNGNDDKVIPLGADDAENVMPADEGNAGYVLATSTRGSRVEFQWQGFVKYTAWIVSVTDGSRKLVKEKQRGNFSISPQGKYVIWYDSKERNYYTYTVSTGAITNITKNIKVPLYDEDDDHPDDPPPYGYMKWHENDQYVYLYDRYDVWQCDPEAKLAPRNFTKGMGRQHKITYRYLSTGSDEKYISNDQMLAFRSLNEVNKKTGLCIFKSDSKDYTPHQYYAPFWVGSQIVKAKNADSYLHTIESYKLSPTLIITKIDTFDVAKLKGGDVEGSKILYMDSIVTHVVDSTNPQQKDYNWLTAELVKWKMFDGKMSEGLLFKPENFDAKKKYPVLFYFYEKNADGLYQYRAPAPSASTINIPWFVSNGYIVFVPDIHYKNGEPGESAYNSVVSAARYLAKMPWVDSTKMGIQGQSWGGYQVAYLITRTNLFAAAEAGAPVSNMTSAYGGIRWGTGLNRQFQYERSQSRIGYTLWQRPDLFIKNSPLFRADKVTTPLLIMHNDADGAVPWYQGIEYFTALRRLGKKVWMLQYNGEDHNLVERRNRKDLSVRLGQYFDYFLKGAPAPRWMAEGLPATLKGIEWGLEQPSNQ